MIVMKFGGTSVEDTVAIRRLIAIVKTQLHRQPVVTVSAMGKTTNGLLECARLAAGRELDAANTKLAAIGAHHFKTADEVALVAERAELRQTLQARFDGIAATLVEIEQEGQVTPRLSDAISANGELLSSVIVAAAFRAKGYQGIWVDVRPLLRTDGNFTCAAVLFAEANPRLQEGFAAALEGGGLPVTQGFIGSTVDGITTTIGRGGSDYSAAIVGAALDAEEIQIWTDVDGIMTTDPRVVAGAAKVKTLSFAEAAELAYFGAKVLHPSTLLPAMAKQIPVTVCNSRRPQTPGTAIVRHAPPSRAAVKAIAFKRGITIINIASDRMLMAHGFLARLFAVFEQHETSVDMVSTSEVSVSVTLDDARHLDALVADLRALGEVTVERDQALLCLVGENLKYTPGLAARIFASLAEINISMISHGASAINVSFVVAGTHLEQAVRRLHQELFRELDAETFEAVAQAHATA